MTTTSDQITSIQKSVQTLTFLVIVLVLAVGILFVKDYTKPNAQGTTLAANQEPTVVPTISVTKIKDLFSKKYIYFGNKNSKNLVVEFSDPSCPYCHFAAGMNPELNREAGAQFQLDTDGGTYTAPVPKIKELVEQNKLGFVWIYQNGHGNGLMGAQALYCAYAQGDFWPVHDLLMSYAGYNLLNDQVKNDVAQANVLADFLANVTDREKMVACLESGKYAQILNENMQVANSFGARGTPNFLVNTRMFEGAYGWKDMQSALK